MCLRIFKSFKKFIIYIENDIRGECEIPKSVFETIAKVILPEVTAYFESEKGKKEYEQYKKTNKQSALNNAV